MSFSSLGPYHNLPSLHLTPYAQGIVSQYATALPWFCTVPTNLTNVTREHQVVTITPVEDDVLIIGAHCQIDDGDNGQNVLLQVNDLKNGIFWSAPNAIFGTPATAYAGSKSNRISQVQLPEAYFLKAGTALRHQWKTYGLATGGTLTWIGLRLQNPIDGNSAEWAILPSGERVKVGSRLPWFCTVGLGEEISVLGSPAYVLGASNLFCGKTAVQDCDIELTGLSANFFVQSDATTTPADILISLTDSGNSRSWQTSKAPSTSMLGSPQTWPVLPLYQPYKLRAGHSMKLAVHSNKSLAINNAYVTFHGVRLCEF